VLLNFNINLNQRTTLSTQHAMAAPNMEPLRQPLQSMLDDPKYWDLTIKCGDRKWRVHKMIVCSQSTYFADLCDGKIKVCVTLVS
jgi:hypothetical protein